MRAFYATHKTVRVFVLGTPDGWHVALYDLTRKEWRHVEEKPHPTLQEAKTCALAHAELLVGRLPPNNVALKAAIDCRSVMPAAHRGTRYRTAERAL